MQAVMVVGGFALALASVSSWAWWAGRQTVGMFLVTWLAWTIPLMLLWWFRGLGGTLVGVALMAAAVALSVVYSDHGTDPAKRKEES